MSDTTIPREKVEQLAANIHELLALKDNQAGTMAEMIRGCIAAIRQGDDPNSSPKVRRAEGWIARGAATKEVRNDKARALLYLEYLATQLENQSTKGEPPCIVE